MKLEYNGVVMDLFELTEYSRECVYSADGADLLYVKHRIGAVCTLAAGGWPAGLSLDPAKPNPGTIDELNGAARRQPNQLFLQGVNPKFGTYPFPKKTPRPSNATALFSPGFWTDTEVRARLSIPRRKLKISAYHVDGKERVWLESPRPFPQIQEIKAGNAPPPIVPAKDVTLTDAANGPIPLQVDVIDTAGEGTSLGVHFMIETCLVPVDPEAERPLLSNRWQVTHTHDDDHYLTRITKGVAVFNGGIMRLAQQSPDWFLNQFVVPIPLGFIRKVPEVTASSDGLSVSYTITDTDPHVMFDPGDSGATSMDIVETLNYFAPTTL